MDFTYLYGTELKKSLAIALGGVGRGRDNGGNVNYVQYKSDWSCHFESPLNNEYILILKNPLVG
jgi:hypothetical protein